MKRRANTRSCAHEVYRIVCPTTWLNKGLVPEYCPRLPLVTELKVIDFLVLHLYCSFPWATSRPRARALAKYARLAEVVCLGSQRLP